MLDFVRVEGAAPFFPHNCRGCGSGKDLLDTIAEDFVGRIYLCRMCISRGARVFGMIEGNRYQELTQADTLLTAANAGLAQNEQRIRDLTADLDALDKQRSEELEELANARQRIEQLEGAIRAQAEQELALVGAASTYQSQLEDAVAFGKDDHATSTQEDHAQDEFDFQREREAKLDEHEDRRDRSGDGDPED